MSRKLGSNYLRVVTGNFRIFLLIEGVSLAKFHILCKLFLDSSCTGAEPRWALTTKVNVKSDW
jgi:hypothetical protein